MNYHVSLINYKDDKYYAKVVDAVEELLSSGREFSVLDVFLKVGVLSPQRLSLWQAGKADYLERLVECNLSKANRILRIVGFHAHDLNLGKKVIFTQVNGKKLRFTKTGIKKLEERYASNYYVIGKKR